MTTGITGKEPDPRAVYADIIDIPIARIVGIRETADDDGDYEDLLF